MLGQFLLLDQTTGSLGLLPSVAYFFSDESEIGSTYSSIAGISEDVEDTREEKVPVTSHTGGLRFVRDSVMEHLFSPFNCPNETAHHVFVIYSYLYVGNYFDVFAIEEKINNFIIFYSEFFKIIRIGLPIAKLIYPFHNFY
jgi:hypothetical protein